MNTEKKHEFEKGDKVFVNYCNIEWLPGVIKEIFDDDLYLVETESGEYVSHGEATVKKNDIVDRSSFFVLETKDKARSFAKNNIEPLESELEQLERDFLDDEDDGDGYSNYDDIYPRIKIGQIYYSIRSKRTGLYWCDDTWIEGPLWDDDDTCYNALLETEDDARICSEKAVDDCGNPEPVEIVKIRLVCDGVV